MQHLDQGALLFDTEGVLQQRQAAVAARMSGGYVLSGVNDNSSNAELSAFRSVTPTRVWIKSRLKACPSSSPIRRTSFILTAELIEDLFRSPEEFALVGQPFF